MPKKPEPKVLVSDEVREQCSTFVRDVHAEFEGNWSQTKCSIAFNRALRHYAQGGLKPAAEAPKQHAMLLQVGVFFSNSSAVRQSVLEKKTASSPSKIEEYKDLV